MFRLYHSVNPSLDPQLRTLIFNDSLNVHTCDGCGLQSKVHYPILYNDVARRFAIWYLPGASEAEYDEHVKETAKEMGSQRLPAGTRYILEAPAAVTWESFKQVIELCEQDPQAPLTGLIKDE